MRRFAVGLLFTGGSLALLGRLIDWKATLLALKAADPVFIGLAVTCLVLSLTAKALRWRFLLPESSSVTTPRLYRIMHISFLLNNVLPARLGDVARVAMTSRQPGLRLGSVLSSLLTERVADAVTLLTCFVVVSPFLPIPGQYVEWLHVAWYTLAGLVAIALLSVVLRRPAARWATRLRLSRAVPLPGRARQEASSFGEGLRQLFSRGHVAHIWGFSAIAWLGAFAINYLVMRALQIDAPVTVAVLLTCVTNLAMLIPSSPGYIGVFHAAATLALLPFDVDAARALSFAIVAHLVNVLPVSLLGAAFLLLGRETISLNLGALRRTPAPAAVDPAVAEVEARSS